MKHSADVVIVGGGLLGTATALFAARAGADVVLLEAGDLASGASGAAFGGVSASIYSYASTQVPPAYVALSLASLELYRTLQEELGPPLDFVQCGSLDPFEREGDRQRFADRVEGLRACGVDVDLLDGPEIRDIEPAVSRAVAGASYCPGDGHVSPQNAVWAFADGARRAGAEIRTGVWTERILRADGKAVGVATTRGEISAGKVVIAAGLGTAPLAATAGVQVPVHHSRGQMFVTERIPPLLRTFLHTIKQTAAGTVVIGATREPDIDDTSTTAHGIQQMMNEAVRFVPGLADARLLRAWAGIRPVPEDGYPIFGFAEGVDNLLVAVMHRGVTLAPVVGEVLADLMDTGSTRHDIVPYRLSRFGDDGDQARVAERSGNY